MDTLLLALDAILPIVLLILLGYFLKRIRLLTKEFLSVGNKVCFRVFLPAFLFYNIYTIESLKDVNWVFIAYGAGAVLALFFIGFLCVSLFVRDNAKKGVLLQAVFRSNFAIIGVPLAMSLFGEEGAAAASLLSAFAITEFNVLGVVSLSAFRGGGERPSVKKVLLGIVKNPLIIGIACAVCVLGVREIFVAADVSFRLSDIGFAVSALEYVAKMATPFGLIMLGGEFEFSAVGRLWKEIAFGTFMRVVFAPALFLTVAYFCIPGLSGAHYASYIALFGTPVAVSSAIMAKEMEGDAELAGQLVVWTTVLSAFTLFAAILIFKSIGAL